MNSVEIFYLHALDRAFHIFLCKKNPTGYAEAYVIESLDSGPILLHRGSMGVFTGTSQGIYLLLCQFVSEDPHTQLETYTLRNEINASMERLVVVDRDIFILHFPDHSIDFQQNAYQIIKRYEPVLAEVLEKRIEEVLN